MIEKTQPKMKKVLFCTGTSRVFRTILIEYLHEISQVYPVVLLSEKLDSETEEILQNKTLFPKLEKIIAVRQLTGKKVNLLSENIYLFKLTKNVLEQNKPDIVIAPSDMNSLFELYLMRFAERENILKVAIQVANLPDSIITAKWTDLTNAYLRFPPFLPFWLRRLFVKCRKYFGHFLYYWILPLMVGEKPFFGKSSHILRRGKSGMRDADYQTVFSKRDYDIFLREGVPAEKLHILSHPSIRNKDFFERVYLDKFKEYKENTKAVGLILPSQVEFGFRRNDNSLIPREEREKKWMETIKLISQILSGWKIYIKPHPDTKDINKIKGSLESISKNIEVANPQEPVDKCLAMADVIIELPLSASNSLFTASLQFPEKPIISLDFFDELLGDYYKDFEGIECIDNEKKFINILKLIRHNKYQKKPKTKLESEGFSSIIELLKHLC